MNTRIGTEGGGNVASSGPAVRVLVVDDESHLAELVATVLRSEGYCADIALTAREALAMVAEREPHLVILDVALPDLDGFDVQSRLHRDHPNVPVLFLTARDSTEDKVRGLTFGADDYVTKPFSLDEFLARVGAVLRRVHAETNRSSRLQVEDLVLDEDTHEVRRGNREIVLSPTEFNLLRYLMVNAGRVVTRSQILDYVWNYDFGGVTGVVATYVSYLRRKIDRPGSVPLIQTVRGFGYSLRPPRG